MKTFIIAIVIFCLTVVIVTVNFIFIHRTIDRLSEMIDDLEVFPDNRLDGMDLSGEIELITAFWNKKKPLVSLSVDYGEINGISNLIASLTSFYESGDYPQYNNAHAILRESVNSLRRLEQFSIDNIF